MPNPAGYTRWFGTWRSLVARSVRDAEVVGSNPAVPTQKPQVRPLSERPARCGPVPIDTDHGPYPEQPERLAELLIDTTHRLPRQPSSGSARLTSFVGADPSQVGVGEGIGVLQAVAEHSVESDVAEPDPGEGKNQIRTT